ncbi:MAG: ATP-grasp domain-containing protein [Pirellulaceae bacterium]
MTSNPNPNNDRERTVLVFEWASGGGCWWDNDHWDPGNVFLTQGHQMLGAVISDILDCGFNVIAFRDSRFAESDFRSGLDSRWQDHNERSTPSLSIRVIDEHDSLDLELVRAGTGCSRGLVIAPETGRRLMACAHWLQLATCKPLFPTGEFSLIASSKHATMHRLRQSGINSSSTVPDLLFNADDSDAQWPPSFSLPAVIKPDDGAGSEGVRFVTESWHEVPRPNDGLWHIEPMIPGISISVAALGSGETFQILTPLYQVVAPTFPHHYREARHPVTPLEAQRTIALVNKVLSAMGPFQGYIGLDLILASSGPEGDTVVDINPRLTTSYLIQRRLFDGNLAAAFCN